LAIALSRLRQAREASVQARAANFPVISASGGYRNSQVLSSNSAASPSSKFSLGADASYQADLFGGRGRTIEAANQSGQLRIIEARPPMRQVAAGELIGWQGICSRNPQHRTIRFRGRASARCKADGLWTGGGQAKGDRSRNWRVRRDHDRNHRGNTPPGDAGHHRAIGQWRRLMSNEASRPLISLRGITKTYGAGATAFQALKGIDLDVLPGEFMAVMGSSGSGKSTAMNIIGCLDVPSGGTFLFKQHDVGALDRDQRALLRRRYLGFVFQGYNLLARTSALENVELPLIYRGEARQMRQQTARAALDRVGLAGWADHTPGELSGGQQQRVAIARAIVTRPELLLADEPTGNLDSERSREIMKLLSDLNRNSGITVLMVTHEPEMAAFAGRIVRFKDGLVERIEDTSGKRAT
jgi:putative ABC transport system ATP-binding protein